MTNKLPARLHDEDLGVRAFAYVAVDPDLLSALLASTGAAPSDLIAAAETEGFAGFILDFLMQSDDRIRAFAAGEGIAPEAVARAHARLLGPID